jgi:hypothetical protein
MATLTDHTTKKCIRDLVRAMESCGQAPGYSTFMHGIDVATTYKTIVRYVREGRWSLPGEPPKWLATYWHHLRLHDDLEAEVYLIYHDCGKWACRTEDWDGRVHFPDHAAVSQRIFNEHFTLTNAARLIGYDMVIHTTSAEEIDEYLKVWSVEDACTLMIAALAEVYANAKMFGGYDSLSFKIKNTHAAKRSMRICKALFPLAAPLAVNKSC